MISARSWIASALTAVAFGLACPVAGLAQDPAKPKDKETAPAKDEPLEKLLEKLEEKEKADAGKDKDKEKDKKPGEVAPKDQDLDKLLEGLGQTKDTPSPDDKKPGGGPGADAPMPPPKEGEGDKKPDDLKGKDLDLDKELLKITGKKEAPKNQKQGKPEEENGPLGQVIKEMRDVEERLGKPDTGEETRKKQTEIVKNLDTLIERIKNAPSQSMAMKMIREGKQPGPQGPPKQPGNQPGAQANNQGTPPTKPVDPKKKAALNLDLAKSVWGQLPAQLRDQMDNVLAERALPSKEELIKLYYMSLGNKNASKED